MTITIHIPSMLFGFFIGYALVATVFLIGFYSGKWNDGFSAGWDAGKKYAEEEAKKQRREGEQE